jgi:peptidoglycan/xylan/chitin deacetylase (PgdA/CDA1 family)
MVNRFGRGPLILMYHRVTNVAADPWAICVSPANFAEHLDVLKQVATPVPLESLTGADARRRLPPRSVAVTFDDGYADFLHEAAPLLESKAVPATLFVTTGNLGTDREFWWDELERLLLRPGTLPPLLEIQIGGEEHRWELCEARHFSDEDARACRRTRSSTARAGTRHALFHSVYTRLFPLAEGERRRTLALLRAWTGDPGIHRADFRSLTPGEVAAVSRSGLVEIGAHTVNHPALSAHSIAAQRAEILESKKTLEEILGHSVTSFSYPHGEYTPDTLALAREANLRRACTVKTGRVTRHTPPLELPRFPVEDWTAAEFEERLVYWLSPGQSWR